MKLAKHPGKNKGSLVPVSKGLTPYWPVPRWQSSWDRLFEEPFGFGGWLAPRESVFADWMPAVNVYDEKNHLVVKADLPGMKKDEIKVFVTGSSLNITGERKDEREEKTAKMYRSERYFGRFHRSIMLPEPVNVAKIEAHYKDGILTVICPKTESAVRKEVQIKVG